MSDFRIPLENPQAQRTTSGAENERQQALTERQAEIGEG